MSDCNRSADSTDWPVHRLAASEIDVRKTRKQNAKREERVKGCDRNADALINRSHHRAPLLTGGVGESDKARERR